MTDARDATAGHGGAAGGHVDPTTLGSAAEFADALTALRLGGGLTVRGVAKETGIPLATVGGYFSGRHLPPPTQPAAFTTLLEALGVPDHDVPAWLDTLVRLRRGPGQRRTDAAPYRGLESYRTEDAALYVGREAEVDQLWSLVSQLVERGEAGDPAAIAVIGPSGSGKSSLLQAGLLGSPHAATFTAHTLSPTDLLDLPAELSSTPSAGRAPRLVVLDQFEQILTERFDLDERRAVIAAAADLAAQPRTVVILGLRADFLDRALTEPLLCPLVRRHQLLVGPLDVDALRRVITEPAERVGRVVAPEVVDLVVQDLAPRGLLTDPATLPLLSHALLVAWENAGRDGLTAATYVASGGVRGAVQRSAENAFAGLTSAEQEAARRLFRRLVLLDADGVVVRRPVALDDLPDDEALLGAADAFVAQRILTATGSGFEISHEAVLVAWPRLRDWVGEDREFLSLRHRLGQAKAVWRDQDRSSDALLRGPMLHLIRELPQDRLAELSAAERDYVRDSVEAGDVAARRRRRQRTGLLVLAISALVLAMVASVLTLQINGARRDADAAREAAETAEAQALSRQIATKSTLLRDTQPSLAAQLAVAAHRISPTLEARSAVLEATGQGLVGRLLGPEGPSRAVASPDGRTLSVAGADGAVRFYGLGDGTSPVQVADVQLNGGQLYASSYDETGTVFAAAGSTGEVVVLDVSDPTAPQEIARVTTPESAGVLSVLVRDGVLHVAAGAGMLRWRLDDTGATALPSGDAVGVITDIARRDDGLLAVAGADGAVGLWRAGTGDRLAAVRRLPGVADGEVTSVAFSPDGDLVAAGSKDGHVRVWRTTGGGPVRSLVGSTSWVNDVEFSPDGSRLAVGGSGAPLQSWDTTTWEKAAEWPVSTNVGAVGWLTDGSSLLSASIDGTTRLWPAVDPQPTPLGDSIWNALRAGDGTTLYVGSGTADPAVRAVDVTDPARPMVDGRAFTAPASAGALDGSASVSPDGRFLVGGTETGQVAVWETAGPRHRPAVVAGATALIEATAVAPDSSMFAVASDDGSASLWSLGDGVPQEIRRLTIESLALGVSFSPDGSLLAVGGADNFLHLFRVEDGDLLAQLPFDSYVYGSAFSPDGALVAAGGADRTVRVWDLADPTDPTLVGEPLTGPAGTVFNVAWAPDGDRLAAAAQDGKVRIWQRGDDGFDLAEELGNLGAGAVGVAWIGDGEALLGTGLDGHLGTWTTDPELAADQICAGTGDEVTAEEWRQLLPGVAYVAPCSDPVAGS